MHSFFIRAWSEPLSIINPLLHLTTPCVCPGQYNTAVNSQANVLYASKLTTQLDKKIKLHSDILWHFFPGRYCT